LVDVEQAGTSYDDDECRHVVEGLLCRHLDDDEECILVWTSTLLLLLLLQLLRCVILVILIMVMLPGILRHKETCPILLESMQETQAQLPPAQSRGCMCMYNSE
jgi:hypothetical protein